MCWHGALLTNALRCSRSLSADSSYALCGCSLKDIIHFLRDCPSAVRFWQFYGFSEDQFFFTSDLQSWLRTFLTGPKDMFFGVIIWWIWRSRCMIIFGDEQWSFFSVCHFISSMLSDINQYSHISSSIVGASSSPRMVSWSKPVNEAWCVNVDGSSLGNPGPAGYGGLIHSSNGEWLCGFSGHVGHATNLQVELYVVLQGLMLAKELNCSSVVCQSDSMEALHLIQDGNHDMHQYACIIYYIRSLFRQDWVVNSVHRLCEGNQYADILAKLGASSSDRWKIWPLPPIGLAPLLLADSMGLAFIRP
ncbi:hypothetical protein RIF29_34021 [Crotalaria pallida]|uniref:RNase H type-1 domain-containing protein n=1 Tax=Crotalaria pallida TaxID=3830 RepID=A0AAN9HR16_CROPI